MHNLSTTSIYPSRQPKLKTMDSLFYSRRMDGPGYLEYIYRKDDVQHERIAYITNIYANHSKPVWYTCVYGMHEFSGASVSSVKEALFDAIAGGL